MKLINLGLMRARMKRRRERRIQRKKRKSMKRKANQLKRSNWRILLRCQEHFGL